MRTEIPVQNSNSKFYRRYNICIEGEIDVLPLDMYT